MNKQLILIVDKDIKNCEKIAAYLSQKYEVTWAYSESQVVTMVERLYMRIRVILFSLDFTSDAMKILKKLRKVNDLPEFILYSKKPSIKSIVEGIKAGALDYISEPITSTAILDATALAIDHINKTKKFKKIEDHTQIKDLDKQISKVKNISVVNKLIELKFNLEEIVSLFPITEKKVQISLLNLLKQINLDELLTKEAKLLIVEDEEHYRIFLNELLKKQYQTFQAQDGTEALQIIQQNKDIDIVLLDIFLPDISGDKLLPQIQKEINDAEVIIITAFEIVEIAVNTLKNGAYDYLNKPVLKEDLFKTILKALIKKRIRQLLPSLDKEIFRKEETFSSKIAMLTDLYQSKKHNNENILMEDIYIVFPELKNTCIPDRLVLPYGLFQDINKFIKDLYDKLECFNPLVNEK
jgi:DNA-binding NtrC family response regulator